MELHAAGLHEQPFRTHGKPLALAPYAAHTAAVAFLRAIYDDKHGLGLLQGPTLSGKSTIAKTFSASLGGDVSVAIVHGDGLDTHGLLASILGQFGYQLELESNNELLNMLRVIAMQQTAAGNPPLLIIENTHLMDAEALSILCEFAKMKVNRQSAMRVVLLSDRSIENILKAPAMACVADRVTGRHQLAAMTSLETRDYLHAKLRAAGAGDPADIMPDSVCEHLYSASGGWPGVVDRLALLALARADTLPIASEHVERTALSSRAQAAAKAPSAVHSDTDPDGPPRLYLTRDGETLGEIVLEGGRLLIGRSEHNDLRIDSHYISRHHAMFVSHGSATLLMDLNSTNGTFVNSRRVSNYVMLHDDIVSLGNHRLKFVHPRADRSVEVEQDGIADTVIMKTLDDMRRLLKGESTQTMPMKAIEKLASGDQDG